MNVKKSKSRIIFFLKTKTSGMYFETTKKGNGAHALAAIGSLQGFEMMVMTLYGDEAKNWSKALAANSGKITANILQEDREVSGKIAAVSKEAKGLVEKADAIIFTVPAFAHAQYLKAIKPHIKKNLILGFYIFNQ